MAELRPGGRCVSPGPEQVIRGYTATQIRAAEAPHLAAGEPLVKRAASGLAAVIREYSPARVLLLVGSGNNGADALYAGAELATEGVAVTIVTTGRRTDESALAAALDAGAQPRGGGRIVEFAGDADVIVDGILGTGTSADPALRGDARSVVQALLTLETLPTVVAVDIPSGIDPDDGSVPDAVVLPADVTVTFGGYKSGLLIEPASRLAGRVVLVDIGLGPELERLPPAIEVPSPPA